MQKRFSICSAGLVLAALSITAIAGADAKVVAHMHVDSDGTTQPDQTITTYYKGSMIRSDAANTITIIDTKSGMTTIIHPGDKAYTQYNVSQLSNSMPMFSDMTIKAKASVQATGLHRDIAGKDAAKFIADIDIVMTPKKDSSISQHTTMHLVRWTTAAVPVDIPPADLAKFSAQQAVFLSLPGMEEVTRELSKIVGLPLSSDMTINTEIVGAPDKQLPPPSKQEISTDVDSISQDPLDDSLFHIPPGYQKVGAPAPPGS